VKISLYGGIVGYSKDKIKSVEENHRSIDQ